MFRFLLRPTFGKSEMRGLIAFRDFAKERYANYNLSLAIQKQSDIKLLLGAGGTSLEGFVSTDFPQFDICNRKSFQKFVQPDTASVFLAEHVWEHLSPSDGSTAANNCFEFLKPGGTLRIAVPDGFHPDPGYIAHVEPNGCGAGASDHKVLYNHQTLSIMLESAGYEVQLLEWFDRTGCFHFKDWDSDKGLVRRSTRFDPRNSISPTAYTSLIIDAIKPKIRLSEHLFDGSEDPLKQG